MVQLATTTRTVLGRATHQYSCACLLLEYILSLRTLLFLPTFLTDTEFTSDVRHKRTSWRRTAGKYSSQMFSYRTEYLLVDTVEYCTLTCTVEEDRGYRIGTRGHVTSASSCIQALAATLFGLLKH